MKSLIIFLNMFSDPLFRGPLIGTLFMSMATALIGSISFVKRKSLVGEVVSHATFPGVAIGMMVAGVFFPLNDSVSFFFILLGAFFSAMIGYAALDKMLKKGVKADAALCYVLASFLGFGVLLASAIQQSHVLWYRKIQIFLYGQAATMTDAHTLLYGSVFFFILIYVLVYRRALTVSIFDPIFSHTLGASKRGMDRLFLIMLCLSIVIGIRSVGALMITGMLVGPAVAARAFSRHFVSFLIYSVLFGCLSSLLGSYLSACVMVFDSKRYLPLGPTIVACSSLIAFLALLLSPNEGVLIRLLRRWSFQKNCVRENLLKIFWKNKEGSFNISSLKKVSGLSQSLVFFSLWKLRKEGFLSRNAEGYFLTKDGMKKAAYIVRLHRLWELYLITYLSTEVEKVHQSAEQMEHLITPEIEGQLTLALKNPEHDPHHQPIPKRELL